MNSERYEDQASACLEAASRHQARLLAVAVKLAGSAEAGMDLFQQTCLNCHDAIQRRGFEGDRYEFYLLTSLRNLYYSEAKLKGRTVGLPAEQWETALPEPATTAPAYAQLAEQVAAAARQQCTPHERIALRLHAEGHSYQDIADLVGIADRWRVRRVLDRVKDALRATFQQAFDKLAE